MRFRKGFIVGHAADGDMPDAATAAVLSAVRVTAGCCWGSLMEFSFHGQSYINQLQTSLKTLPPVSPPSSSATQWPRSCRSPDGSTAELAARAAARFFVLLRSIAGACMGILMIALHF